MSPNRVPERGTELQSERVKETTESHVLSSICYLVEEGKDVYVTSGIHSRTGFSHELFIVQCLVERSVHLLHISFPIDVCVYWIDE